MLRMLEALGVGIVCFTGVLLLTIWVHLGFVVSWRLEQHGLDGIVTFVAFVVGIPGSAFAAFIWYIAAQ